ncbi:MAG: VCBS repeat-containing protein, partial [Thermoguttaceae bacterium]
YGLINPKFTPADLVKASEQIISLEVTGPVGDSTVKARVVASLKGAAPAAKDFTLDISDTPDSVLNELKDAVGQTRAAAILFVGNYSAASTAAAGAGAGRKHYGALMVNRRWFAVYQNGTTFALDKDEFDLLAVWAGTARRMVDAVKYAVENPNAAFPITVESQWGAGQSAGKLRGAAAGCLAADLQRDGHPVVIVLSEAGDQVFKQGASGIEEVTAKLGLLTKSRQAVVVDVNGDGRLDFVSWNGKEVVAALQNENGSFAAPKSLAALDGKCYSLSVLSSGRGKTARLVAGTPGSPVILAADSQGKWTITPVADAPAKAALEKLGGGGYCLVADISDKGLPDIVQFYAGGLACWTAAGDGFKPAVVTTLPLKGLPSSAVAGDYDGDGLLDLVVSGETGTTMLSRRFGDTWNDMLGDTAELEYHGTLNGTPVVNTVACDINRDGRQGVALLYRTGFAPKIFFNRGFGCFGYGRTLDLGSLDEPAAKAMGQGVQAGTVVDLNEDGAPDLFVADTEGGVQVLYGKTEDRRPVVQLALPDTEQSPLTVRVIAGKRLLGMHVVQPGFPAITGLESKGPILLEWTDRSGAKQSKKEVILKSKSIIVRP